MAMWADELILIGTKEPDERVDAAGFPNEPEEEKTQVFFNRKSVGYGEFYASTQAGYEASFKAELNSCDYNGQLIAEYCGKRYRVLKTYELSDDVIELTLSDLKEGLAESEG